MDVESLLPVERTYIGGATADVVRIASTPRGVLVAMRTADALEPHWFTDGANESGQRSLAQLGAKKGQELRGLAVFDDRIVLATTFVRLMPGPATTTVWVLDAQGKLLDSHACHGGLYAPGDATFVRSGDDVIVANFVMNDQGGLPVCAGRLHGPPHWREVTLHDGTIEVAAGGVYFHHSAGPEQPMLVNALDESLRPTGLPAPARSALSPARCDGLTGTVAEHAEEIGGQEIVYMIACCGDTGGGLFVCRPPKRGR